MPDREETRSKEATQELIITRKIDAPRQLVWDTFTRAEHLRHWWGPKGFELIVKKLDLNAGGIFHYQMKGADGNSMWGLFNYLEIEAPVRIVFTNSFSDENGNIARAPFFDGRWPMEILNTWIFEEEDGKTILTLHSKPINTTDQENRAFEGNMSSMHQGFGGTFDKLDVYLKTLVS